MDDPVRNLLRHTVATLAYRASKALLGVPEGFSSVKAGETTRTTGQILAHMGDLFDWAVHMANGDPVWRDVPPGEWSADVARFFDGLARLDEVFATKQTLGFPAEQIFQGPIADALTHVGQIATLRRLAGSPVIGESYFRAEIVTGRVGPDQAESRVTFA